MGCTPTKVTTELEFVQALVTRSRELGDCRGPLLRLVLSPWEWLGLEHAFDSEAAHDVLLGGLVEEGDGWLTFALCAAHWLDLAALVWMRAQQHGRSDWHDEADHLLREVCQAASWDAKEILNMFAWQRARLT